MDRRLALLDMLDAWPYAATGGVLLAKFDAEQLRAEHKMLPGGDGVVSDEIRYLTAARHLNWDVVAENQRNASRAIGEDTEHLLFNEVLNASDKYAVTAVLALRPGIAAGANGP